MSSYLQTKREGLKKRREMEDNGAAIPIPLSLRDITCTVKSSHGYSTTRPGLLSLTQYSSTAGESIYWLKYVRPSFGRGVGVCLLSACYYWIIFPVDVFCCKPNNQKKVRSPQSDSSCFSLKHSPFCFLWFVLSCFSLSIYARRAEVESMDKVARLVSVWVRLTLWEYRINSAATTLSWYVCPILSNFSQTNMWTCLF